MEHQNRPQGRKPTVSGKAGDVYRRGEGLNTGPVGSGSRPGAQQRPNAGQRPGVTRPIQQTGGNRPAGKRSPLIAVAALLLLLLGGGGGLFGSGLLSEDGADYSYSQSYSQPSPTAYSSYNYNNSGSGGASSQSGSSAYDSLVPSAGGSASSAATPAVSGAAAQARGKYTTIYGGGRDEVTVMVYLCGTDLESRSAMATKDLLEMTKATLGNHVRILVYTGGCTKWNNNIVSAKVNQIYQVSGGGLQCLVENAGSTSMTDPKTLTSFIQFCAENYPANRQELILWDHGSGTVSGYGYDQKYPNSGSMSLAALRSALEASGQRFDFIGFDACLMATMETALMLEPYADYLIASEETEPGIGWYYTDWLSKLGANPALETLELGKRIVDDFVTTCARECRGQSATLSVVDLAELDAAAREPMKSFASSLSTAINGGQYSAVSSARNGSREFARSSVIDQIDLVDFAERVGNREGKALSEALRGAIKYNRVSSDMSRAYGLSIYFPYRKLSNVDKAVSTYSEIGMDESYSQCIRDFAGLETGGQLASGGTHSPYDALLGGGYSSYSYDSDMLGSLLESLLGGGLYGLDSSNSSYYYGRSMSNAETADYIAANHFDASQLVWREGANGTPVLRLTEEQWALVEDIDLNLFYDDGEGYIDLGLDNVFDFDENGDLLLPDEPSWLAVDGQVVAYYHDTSAGEGSAAVYTGHIPVYLNGERAELLVLFDAQNPDGVVTGARRVYLDGETETVAKSESALEEGDVIDFVCDYYRCDGSYENSYLLGERYTVSGTPVLSNLSLDDAKLSICFRFTDLYQQHYWTPAVG